MSSPDSKLKSDPIARIPLNLRAHKLVIALPWLTIFLTSCILPLIGYFTMHYLTTVKTQTILSIFTPIFGAVSLSSFILRTVRLAQRSSTCRPLSSSSSSNASPSAWQLDYFNWNFALGFIVVTIVIAVGIAQNPSNVRIASLPLTVLILQVCGQMVVLIPLRALRVRAPVQISSYGKGEMLRPACYTIAEDVVAVDGKQDAAFRQQWAARWESSEEFRRLLGRLDVLWGVSGLLVAGAVIGVIFGVKSTSSAGWAVGWSVPWIWAIIMTITTIQMTKSMCKRENMMAQQPYNGA